MPRGRERWRAARRAPLLRQCAHLQKGDATVIFGEVTAPAPHQIDETSRNGEWRIDEMPMSFDANKNKKMALLVEEKPICRVAIGRILQEEHLFDFVDNKIELRNSAEMTSGGDYQLILIDLFTINYNFELLKDITSRFGGAGMLAIDDRNNPLFSRATEAIGLSGYVAKIFEMETLSEAISTVLAGGKWYSHDARPGDNSEGRAKSGELAIGLTTRQSEILVHLSLGRTNQEIALVLGISPGTVKTHVHAILKLVGARNRTEAALLAGRLFRNEIADR